MYHCPLSSEGLEVAVCGGSHGDGTMRGDSDKIRKLKVGGSQVSMGDGDADQDDNWSD